MNTDEIKQLAQIERNMDFGLTQFVMLNGQRWAVMQEIMTEFDLKCGQTVNNTIINAILDRSIKMLEEMAAKQITIETLAKIAEGAKS